MTAKTSAKKPKAEKLRSDRSIARKVGKARSTLTITTRRDLFSWIYNHLDNLEPRVAVEGKVIAAREEFFDAIMNEEYIQFSPVYWGEIFSDIDWTNQEASAAHRCGAKLMGFMGELGDAIRASHGAIVPPGRAIEMMLECSGDTAKHFRFVSSGKRRWVKMTPHAAKTFGIRVRVDLPCGSLDEEDLWDLSVHKC